MRAQGWKVPTVLTMVALLAACGREAESAAARDTERVVLQTETEEPAVDMAPVEQPVLEDAARETAPPVAEPTAPSRPTPVAGTEKTPEPPVLVRTDPEPSVAPNEPATARPEVKPEPEPEILAVPAGTQVVLTVEDELSTEVNRAGDPFDAVVAEDVLGGSGVVLVPRGARVRGVVLESTESPASDRPAILALGVERVELADRLVPVVATVTELEHEAEARDSDTRTAAKVGAGAVAGALLGKILGGDGDDALKGAVVGVAAGAAVAHATRAGHAKVPEGARMVIVLDQDLQVEGALRDR